MLSKAGILTATLVLAGCATSVPQATSIPAPAPAASAQNSERDGRSFESAIVIQAANESDGVAAEYAWIRSHLPGAKPAGQSLQGHEKRMFDVVHISLPDGSRRDVYFDITGFFGKF